MIATAMVATAMIATAMIATAMVATAVVAAAMVAAAMVAAAMVAASMIATAMVAMDPGVSRRRPCYRRHRPPSMTQAKQPTTLSSQGSLWQPHPRPPQLSTLSLPILPTSTRQG